MEHRALIFFVAILYHLPERWRGMGHSRAFDKLLSAETGCRLDEHLYKLCEEGLFYEFADYFEFDPIYGVSPSFRVMLGRSVVSYGLVRLCGSHFTYHLDHDTKLIAEALERNCIPPEKVRTAARRLTELIDMGEKSHIASPTFA